jgi:hypothetical protein
MPEIRHAENGGAWQFPGSLREFARHAVQSLHTGTSSSFLHVSARDFFM